MQHPYTLDLGHLRVLRELHERGTVTAAARALHLTPSAVSQQLRSLARTLGVPLTERTGRRLRLTPQALLVLRHAESIAAQIERVKADLASFQTGDTGSVTIASFASAISPLLIPALQQLTRERGHLEISVRELEPPQALAALEGGEIDVLVTVDYANGPTKMDGRYHRTDLVRDPLAAVLPRAHLFSSLRTVHVHDLANETWIMGSPGHPCVDVTLAAQATAGFTATVGHRANDWAAAAALVASGQGVAFIPELALRGMRRAGITVLPIRPPIARNIYAAVRKGSETAPHIAATINALRATGVALEDSMAQGHR